MAIFTKLFWAYAGERLLKTLAQTALALLPVGAAAGILTVAWIPLLSAVALAGVFSVLTSVLAYTPNTVTVTVPA